MLKKTIKIHDKFSIVINVTYDKIFKRKISEYTSITYLFFPDSLNINNNTYPSTKFYNDVRLFIKYNTPNYKINEIIEKADSPLVKLEKQTKKFIKNNSTKNSLLYEDQVKMFASIFSSLLSKQTDKFLTIQKLSFIKIDDYLDIISKILTKYRVLVDKTATSSLHLDSKRFIYYADEHISNVVELQMTRLYNYLQDQFSEKELISIIKIIDFEQKYKKKKAYSSPKDKSIRSEELLYKRNQLKKYIDSVFFLKQEIRKDGTVLEQTLLAISAGFAMVFSTGIAFYFQQYYGNFTTPFFIALVVGYMLKDRIKGVMSMLFVSKSSSLFYDYKIKITNSLDKKIGLFKESFAFIPFNKLGLAITKYRFKDRIINTKSLREQIIQYKKKVIIYPEKFGNDLPDEDIVSLTDITRFNFQRFIQYMDDPEKDFILVKKGEIHNKVADKVYPINIIQKYFTKEGIEFNRFRIIMSRNGIKRIEKVSIFD
ncbi:hypothetical protein PHEL85_1344 [Polaribacter sp. Hel1_85]|nr:hypothetical protein PHEL85_1344 [Polaribacter sp. Hel1_85]